MKNLVWRQPGINPDYFNFRKSHLSINQNFIPILIKFKAIFKIKI